MGEGGRIDRFSPSLVVALRRCGLATYWRRIQFKGQSDAPSNPVARLGNAAHRVLEWVANEAPELANDPGVEARIRGRWIGESAAEEAASHRHVVEASYGPSNRWPRYNTIEESLVVDGAALATELADLSSDCRWAERKGSTSAGDLYGSIDLVIVRDDGTATVIDHKAGTVASEDVGPDGRYRVQVLLYSAIVRDLGLTPSAAQIRPLGRSLIDIMVNDAVIDEAYQSAKSDVARYNTALEQGAVFEMARPSAYACQWCEFLLRCPAARSNQGPGMEELRSLEGTILQLQDQGGGRIALKLAVVDQPSGVVISGLSTAQAPAAAAFSVGDVIRVVGLSQSGATSYRAGGGRFDAALVSTLAESGEQDGSTPEDALTWRLDGE